MSLPPNIQGTPPVSLPPMREALRRRIFLTEKFAGDHGVVEGACVPNESPFSKNTYFLACPLLQLPCGASSLSDGGLGYTSLQMIDPLFILQTTIIFKDDRQ